MKRTNILKMALSLAATAIFLAASCEQEPYEYEYTLTTPAAYVLNSGTPGGNDADILYVDIFNNSLVPHFIYNASGTTIGSEPRDIWVYNNGLMIPTKGNNEIVITSLNGNLLTTFTKGRVPDYMAADTSYAYVGYTNGIVSRLNPAKGEIDAEVEVGGEPKQMVSRDGKLYVANSSENNIAVINTKTFTLEKKISTASNPHYMTCDSTGTIFFICLQSSEADGTLNILDKHDNIETIKEIVNPYNFSVGADNKIYCLCKDKNGFEVKRYDWKSDKAEGFIAEGETMSNNPTAIDVNPVTGQVFIVDNEGKDSYEPGQLYVYSTEGKLVKLCNTYGSNPCKTEFLIAYQATIKQ